MKITVKSSELQQADVTHVSLVERGANRVPFKITKSDTKDKGGSMFNLDLGSLVKKSGKTPEFVGLLLSKDAAIEEVFAALKAAGLKVEDKVTGEGGETLLKQASFTEDQIKEATVVKLSDNVAVIVKGFDCKCLEGTPFAETLKNDGYVPGVTLATDALHTRLRTSFAGDKDGPAKIEKAVKEFGTFIAALAAQVPALAVKAEAEVERVLAEKAKTPAKKSVDEMLDAGDTDETIMKALSLDETAVKGYRSKWKKRKDDAAEAEAKAKKEADAIAAAQADEKSKALIEAMTGQIAKALEPVTKQVGEIATSLKAVQDGQTALTERVGKSETALKSITVGGHVNEDQSNREHTVKDTGSLGQIDTAFNPSVRKAAAGRGAHVRRQH